MASLAIQAVAVALLVAAGACAVKAHGLLSWAPGLVSIGYDTLLLALVVGVARASPRATPVAGAPPPVAVLVAAHDEASTLPSTLQALLAQHVAPDVILVVDDGSRDGTAAMLAEAFGLAAPPLGSVAASAIHPSLRWLRLPHGGKAQALNAALLAVETEVVITVDADTRLDPRAVGRFGAAFLADRRLVAVAGALRPVCHGAGLARLAQVFQHAEYAGNDQVFAAWASLGMLLHIPGACAAYRRDALVAVGGFDPDSLVEDYELIHRLRRHAALGGLDWTTGTVEACATTEAPASVTAFLRQRRRWFCGFLQTQLWYRDIVGAARFGRVGRLMLPIKAFDTLQPLHGLLAIALLPVLACRGRFDVLAAAVGLLAAKAMLDLGVAALAAARDREARLDLRRTAAAALVGAVTFQVLRQFGALLGWIAFLVGDHRWRRPARAGLVASRDTDGA